MSPADHSSDRDGPARSGPGRPTSSRSCSSRRSVLAALGVGTAGALAGCNAVGVGQDSPSFTDGDWYSYGNGPANTNYVSSAVPEVGGHDRLAPASYPYAPPVVHDGVVYFGNQRWVNAFSPAGDERWERLLDAEVSGALAIDPGRGRLYVPVRPRRSASGTGGARVMVLSLTDGRVIDTLHIGEDKTYGVTIVDGDLYVRTANACIRLAPDGTERWRRPLDPLVYDEYRVRDIGASQVAPAVAEGGVYVPDRDALVKFDPESGEERWRVPVDTAYAAPVVDDGGIVQTGAIETAAVDHSGAVRWRRDLQSRAAAATAPNGDVYVSAESGLRELDPETGETNWQAHISGVVTAAPLVTDRSVLVADGGGRAFRRETGGLLTPDRERWENRSVGVVQSMSPVIAAGRALVVTHRGLVAFKPTSDG